MNERELVDQIIKTLSPEDAKLIHHIRQIGWGRTEVEIKAGKPVMMHVPREDIKLTK